MLMFRHHPKEPGGGAADAAVHRANTDNLLRIFIGCWQPISKA
jgi:hypothetical protein